MSFQRLPGDVLLHVARNVDDRALANMAKTWNPMLSIVQSGQATREEVKLYLGESNLKESPRGRVLRSQNHRQFLDMLKQFSLGWSQLQWSTFGVHELLDGRSRMQWADGTEPMQPSFMGESGGCLYFVHNIPSSRHDGHYGGSQVTVFKPACQRTREAGFHKQHSIPYPVCAVAIDSTLGILALLTKPSSWGTITAYLLDMSNANMIASFQTNSDLNWYDDVKIVQFDIIGDMLGFALEYPLVPGAYLYLAKWQRSRETQIIYPFRVYENVEKPQHQWAIHNFVDSQFDQSTYPQYRPLHNVAYSGYQFVQSGVVLLIEQSERKGLWGTRLRRTTIPMNNTSSLLFKHPLLGLARHRGWEVTRVTFIPCVGPIEDANTARHAPFYFDPAERLVGVRYEYDLPHGTKSRSVELFDLNAIMRHEKESKDIPGRIEVPMDVNCEGFVLMGRRLLWVEHSATGEIIHMINFSHSALPRPQGHQVNPNDSTWITVTETRNIPGFGRAMETRMLSGRRGALRTVITHDSLMFLMKNAHDSHNRTLCAWVYEF
ncbi:hypothetical protein Hypma_007187 [Hypsizygus marmoreus]|uniref:Uncharacterized protein n=1 Tax=Hypsizygus marmoreus TaxID=39966 RepID=A0A369KCX8_HYPMA|nr:hypothetical protein Hypma_007187 [Hypsizygus marmoreus]